MTSSILFWSVIFSESPYTKFSLNVKFFLIPYLCPTYANSNKYSTASEIYAFGILLIEIITGKVQSKENEEGDRIVDVFCKYANGISGVNALLPMPQVKEKATEWLMNNKDSRIPVDLNILKEISVVAINCLNIEPEKRQNMSGILRRLQLLYNNCWNEHEKALENEIRKLFLLQLFHLV